MVTIGGLTGARGCDAAEGPEGPRRAAKAMSTMLKFTDQNFENEAVKSPIPVLVDFSAVWCGPCKSLAPIVEDLSREYAGRIKIGKLDIDEDRETPTRFDVMAVPTLIFLKGGKEVARFTGLRPRAAIKEQLDAVLSVK